MKLRVKSINGAAAGVAFCAAALSVLWSVVIDIRWTYALTIAFITLLVTYVTAYTLFNRFVLFRIKPIYQILLSKNIRIRELQMKEDVMEDIQDKLNSWVEKNAKEINLLQEQEKYRKEFLGDVSHELKTPIFNVQGYILTLLDGGLEDQNINRKYLERAEKSIDRLIHIIEDLDQISRLESNSLILDKRQFDIVALTREIAEDIEMLAAKRGIGIRIGSGAGQPPVIVYADRESIHQVLTNLMVNAVKYGNEKGMIKVGFIDGFDKVMVEVEDNGIGIPPELVHRVFERFFRADKSRSRDQGGTGLGLAIVKHILEAHGQSVTLRSAPGEGSTFSFTLEKRH